MNPKEKQKLMVVITAAMAIAFLLGGAKISAFAREFEPLDDRTARMDTTLRLTGSASGLSELPGETELFGTVEVIGKDSWTVEGVVLTLLPGTEIKGTFQVGDEVKVHVIPFGEGLAAREIEAALVGSGDDDSSLPGQVDEFEFFGSVEAISPESWTVAGQVFAILPGTEIKGTFQVGDVVKVHAFETADGLAAREIEAALEETGDDFDDDQGDDHSEDDSSGSGQNSGPGSQSNDDDDNDDDEDDHSGSNHP